jgi:Phage integrase, N-terminal SAM-like domain
MVWTRRCCGRRRRSSISIRVQKPDPAPPAASRTSPRWRRCPQRPRREISDSCTWARIASDAGVGPRARARQTAPIISDKADAPRVVEERETVPQPLASGRDQVRPDQDVSMTGGRPDVIVAPAPCYVGMEQSMPRRRYQRGRIISRGKKRKVWVGIFREDRVRTDGTIHRARRSVVLGSVKHVSKLQAIEALRPYLDAVNLVATPKAKGGRTLKNFVEEWKNNVAPTLKPSTVRAAESHLRTHILPTMGEMSLTAINYANGTKQSCAQAPGHAERLGN